MKYSIATIFIITCLLSASAYSCCSSPLADVVYEGQLVNFQTVEEDGDTIYTLSLKNDKNIFGEGPELFEANVNAVTLEQTYGLKLKKGNKYLVVLYDASKHDSKGWLLSKEKWSDKKFRIHPYIGLLNIDSNKSELVRRNIKYYGDLIWTNDFKLIQIFFSE